MILVVLHETLESSDDDWNRLMSGACLFCVYAKARWSDFIHSGKMSLDRLSDGTIAYVEMDVAIHKTMFASARRFRFLNLAARGLGVQGTDWVSINGLQHLRSWVLIRSLTSKGV